MLPFYAPWKQKKTKGFPVFSGSIKWEHWPGLGKQSVARNFEIQKLISQFKTVP